jgi:hypothetical protein
MATAATATTALASIATALATSASTLISSSSVAAPTTTSSSGPKGENNGECQLLGPFAVVVQAALGLLALLSLVYKRWRERPQRPVKVWAFDASKQVFGSALLHLANLFMSMFSSGELTQSLSKTGKAVAAATASSPYQPNPCSYYLLNLGIDTTLGIPILICILKVLHVGASYTPLARPPESIKSGYYGEPPRASWWLKQSLIYFAGLVGMKLCVFIIFQLCPWIVKIGDWALRWTEGNEALQIAFVMLIFPLIMNGLQYYIVDIFIKDKSKMEENADGSERHDETGEQGRLLAADGAEGRMSDDGDVDEEVVVKSKESLDEEQRLGVVNEGSNANSSVEREAVADRPRI